MNLESTEALRSLESALAIRRLDRVVAEQQRRATPPSWPVGWADVPALERVAARDGRVVSARHVLGRGLEVHVQPEDARVHRATFARPGVV